MKTIRGHQGNWQIGGHALSAGVNGMNRAIHLFHGVPRIHLGKT